MDDFSWPCANKFEWIRYTDFRVQNVFQVNFQWRWVVVRLVWPANISVAALCFVSAGSLEKCDYDYKKIWSIYTNAFWAIFAQPLYVLTWRMTMTGTVCECVCM